MDFDKNIPIYIQLVEIIKKDIISGSLEKGSRLPSVRDLAVMMKVNPNTVQRALSDLEELKLIYTERTNGKYVTNDEKLINKYKEEWAKNLINKFLLDMESIGLKKETIINYLNELEGGK